MALLTFLAGVWFALVCPLAVQAHDAPPSVMLMDIGERSVGLEIQLPKTDLATAAGLPLAGAGRSAQERAAIGRYVLSRLDILAPDGRAFAGTIRSITAKRTDNANWVSNDWVVVHADFRAPPGASTERMTLASTIIVHRVLSHQMLVYVRADLRNELIGDQPMQVGVLGYGMPRLRLDGADGSWLKGFLHLFSMGMHHIIEGPDHLLFLLTILLAAPLCARDRRWRGVKAPADTARGIVQVVTGFTVGHSATLALAAFDVAAPPARLIEILIAVSILVSSAHAWRPLFARREMWIATGFGLVHGLAFAEVLKGLNFDAKTLIVSLVGFNAGIEAMQIMVIAVLLPTMLLSETSQRFGHVIRICGAGFAAICALGWIVQRAFGWANPVQAIADWLAPPPPVFMAALAILGAVSAVALYGRRRRVRVDRHGALGPSRLSR